MKNCSKHPNYKAVLETRTNCEGCWDIWVGKLEYSEQKLKDLQHK